MASRMTPPAVSKAVLDKILEIGDQLMDSEVINDLNELNDHMRVWEQYDENKQYFQLNKVAHEGNSYINIKASRGIAPPDEEHWLLIAARGEDGEGIGDMLKSVYDKNDNDIVDMSEDTLAVGGIPAYEMATKEFSKSYTDEQIALVTETGIPKPVRYEYKIEGLTGQDTFEIPLPTFDIDTDIVSLFINTNFIDKTRYTVTERDIILNGPLEEDKIVVIVIDKNVPMGPDGSVSPEVLSHINVDDSQVPTANTGSISTILSNEANMIKQITGEDDWKTTPVTSLSDLNDTVDNLKAELTGDKYVKIHATYEAIISPSSVRQGAASVAFEGLTLYNMVENGDFSNGFDKWTLYQVTKGDTEHGFGYLTPTNQYGGAFQRVSFKAGEVVYLSARIKTTSDSFHVSINKSSGNPIAIHKVTSLNATKPVTLIARTQDETVDPLIVFQDYSSSAWPTTGIGDVIFLNLTQIFGVGNEPTKEQCDKWTEQWFDKYLHVAPTLMFSADTKLNKQPVEIGGLAIANGEEHPGADRYRSKGYDMLVPNTTYVANDTIQHVFLYDKQLSFITLLSSVKSFTAHPEARYFRYTRSTAHIEGIETVITPKDIISKEYNSAKLLQFPRPFKQIGKIKDKYVSGHGAVFNISLPTFSTEGPVPTGTFDEVDLYRYGFDASNLNIKGPIMIEGVLYTFSPIDSFQTPYSYRLGTANDANNRRYIMIRVPKGASVPQTIEVTYTLLQPVYVPDKGSFPVTDGIQQLSLYAYEAEVVTTSSTTIVLERPLAYLDGVYEISDGKATAVEASLNKDRVTIEGVVPGTYLIHGKAFGGGYCSPDWSVDLPVNLRSALSQVSSSIMSLNNEIEEINNKVDMLMVLNS